MAKTIQITPEAARRLARAVKHAERGAMGSVPRPKPPVVIPANWYALVTTEIGAADLTATPMKLGTGKVTLLLKKTDASGNVTLHPLAGNVNVPVDHGGALIAAGRVIQVKVINGSLSVDVDYC